MARWIVALLVGCAARKSPVQVEQDLGDATSDQPWAQREISRHMQQHFAAATDAVWAMALGDLDQMRDRAKTLDHDPPPGMHEVLHPLAAELRSAAAEWATLTDLDAAATQSAVVAKTCSNCHVRSGAVPPLTQQDVTMPEVEQEEDHSAAPYLLWVSLVTQSDAAWKAGSRHLIPTTVLASTSEHEERWFDVRQRAKTALGQERSAVWADIIGSCAPCHEAAGIAP